MTDTNTSGADVLARLDSVHAKLLEYTTEGGHPSSHEAEDYHDARTAVAALIEREAALTAAHAATERDACLQAERANELQSRLAALTAERDALAAEVKALRAERDGLRSVVNLGEVLVEVHGLTGSGKSAVAGEIEILCKALGLDVRWENGDEEKFLTHADWTAALELYAPRVRIVEINTPRPAASDAARASAATGGGNG